MDERKEEHWRKARKKPVIVEFREVEPKLERFNPETKEWEKGELVYTKEGTLFARCNRDYIIRGIEGELYPIRKDIFYKTYDVLEERREEDGSNR